MNSLKSRAGTAAAPGSSTWASAWVVMVVSRLVPENVSFPSWAWMSTFWRMGMGAFAAMAPPVMFMLRCRFSFRQVAFMSLSPYFSSRFSGNEKRGAPL